MLSSTEESYLDESTDSEAAIMNLSSILDIENHGDNKLYTIVLFFTGQQASGVQALINLQCRAHSLKLPMVILEPIICHNKLKAMPSLELNESDVDMMDQLPLVNDSMVMQFSDLFDLELFNNMSSNMGYPVLAERDFFFDTAPRKIVFVVLYEAEKEEQPEIIRLWPEHNSLVDHCFDPLSSQLSFNPKYQIYQLIQKGFCVIKVILYRIVRGEELIFSESQLRRYILGISKHSIGDFTLVFNIWMPKFVMPGYKGRECIHLGYRSSKEQVQPSRELLASAKYYEDTFLKSNGNHVTLMIRLEHVYLFLHRPLSQYGDWSVQKCLNSAVEKVKVYQSRKPRGKPFVTLDIGKYGSETLDSAVVENIDNDVELIDNLLSSIYNGKWNISAWEESFIQASGGIVDRSYIAALQRTLASKADCLVLVGGGKFQELTLRKYMSSHETADWCIDMYCVDDRGSYVI